MRLRTIKDADIKKGTRVILRADFDVAIKNGKIQDDFRIRETLPTIRYLLQKGANVLILTKRGHFRVRRSKAMSTKALLPYLERTLGVRAHFLSDIPQLQRFSSLKKGGQLFLFENIRFWPEEEANDTNFARSLARGADIYVSDNFGTSHRAHASVVGIPKFIPSYSGLLLEREILALEKLLKNSRRPLVAVLGGAKLETKLPLLKRFLKIGDAVLVGGMLANTLLVARGYSVGKSLVDSVFLKKPDRGVLNSKKLYLPIDLVAAGIHQRYGRKVGISDVGSKDIIFDIGPKTVGLFKKVLRRAKTVVWNGPLGLAEVRAFSRGTVAIARELKKSKAFRVVGGGDTTAILNKYRLLKGFSHVSTGGGAMLEFLAGKKLPGIEVLRK